ncbi:DNA/RNA helicase domain-containing protein [Allokutzneria sp. NRRL B-24872]|uniref:DNA/RNA helicase domain-containing protein n=1 Tax=Allokutzneria sp. NRRL B-24872 TaxID=1137961 RepID=UPI000A38EA7D|nr:DNA/RNA helicase domain-containing protein [Allokutzneria sp. NRRL B-24872]
MALVRRSAQQLLPEAQAGRLHLELAEKARVSFESGVGASEIRSWEKSLPVFLADVVDAGLGHVEVLLEHKLPHNPKRVDVILCGTHPKRGTPSYVVVELKQWSTVDQTEGDMVVIPRYGQPVLHPSDQVRGYCEYLIDSTPALAERPGALHGFAYLHNATKSGVWRISNYAFDEYGLYTLDTKAEMADKLRELLDTTPSARDAARHAAEEFLSFKHAPSKPLLDQVAVEVKEREQFVLVDEQQVAFKMVKRAVEQARVSKQQTVVVILGGPGSGKSVIALSLLGELARQGRRVYHATGSSAFTNTLRKLVKGRTGNIFKFFNSFTTSEEQSLDMIICDEAHRIRETSSNRFTSKAVRDRGRRQVNELIDVARVPVFLLDEHQVVRPGEMGSLAEITAAAEALGCRVDVVRLSGQYRCGGSEFFDTWGAGLLGTGTRQPTTWSSLAAETDEKFLVRSADSVEELEQWLLERQQEFGGTARIAAGYCWRWSAPVSKDGVKVLVPDVQIGSWQRPWNAKPNERVADAPESHYWASDPRGFGQVGCVYTAQGFEYDWAGVIFGPDFVRREGSWVAETKHSHDPLVKRAESAHFHSLIRNTYKVLLTRGMRGVCLYSTDPETQEYLRKMTG